MRVCEGHGGVFYKTWHDITIVIEIVHPTYVCVYNKPDMGYVRYEMCLPLLHVYILYLSNSCASFSRNDKKESIPLCILKTYVSISCSSIQWNIFNSNSSLQNA